MRSVAKEYDWKYKAPAPGVFDSVLLIAKVKGADAALRRYSEFQRSGSGTGKVEEWMLNAVGLQLLNSDQERDAIAILQRNVREYPASANPTTV